MAFSQFLAVLGRRVAGLIQGVQSQRESRAQEPSGARQPGRDRAGRCRPFAPWRDSTGYSRANQMSSIHRLQLTGGG